jgi:hypothetical protein
MHVFPANVPRSFSGNTPGSFPSSEPCSRSFLLSVSHERSGSYDLRLFSRGDQTPGH